MKGAVTLVAVLTMVACAGPDAGTEEHAAGQDRAEAVRATEPVDPGLTMDQLNRIAQRHDVREVMILKPIEGDVSPWSLVEGIGLGVDRSDGQVLSVAGGQEVRDGVWLFRTGGTFLHEDGFEAFLDDNTLVVGGPDFIAPDLAERFEANGSVECNPGFYACCGKNQHGQLRAICVPDGQSPSAGADEPTDCIHGGPGASGCSIGSGAYVVYPR